MLLEIIDTKPDIKVEGINEDQKTRPQKVASGNKHEYQPYAPQETGVVILSRVIKSWSDDIFYCHNVEFMQLGQYVMRFTLVAPAAAVARMLRGGKKGSYGRYDNSNSQDPEETAQLLQARNMEPISKPFDYAVDLLREKLALLTGPRGGHGLYLQYSYFFILIPDIFHNTSVPCLSSFFRSCPLTTTDTLLN